MVWQLHCAGIPFAWSTALDAGADFTSAFGRSRRNLSSKIVAPQIAAACSNAGAGNSLLMPGTTCHSMWRGDGNVSVHFARQQALAGMHDRRAKAVSYFNENWLLRLMFLLSFYQTERTSRRWRSSDALKGSC